MKKLTDEEIYNLPCEEQIAYLKTLTLEERSAISERERARFQPDVGGLIAKQAENWKSPKEQPKKTRVFVKRKKPHLRLVKG